MEILFDIIGLFLILFIRVFLILFACWVIAVLFAIILDGLRNDDRID